MAKKKAKDNAKAPVRYHITFILICIFIYQLDWHVLLRMPTRNGFVEYAQSLSMLDLQETTTGNNTSMEKNIETPKHTRSDLPLLLKSKQPRWRHSSQPNPKYAWTNWMSQTSATSSTENSLSFPPSANVIDVDSISDSTPIDALDSIPSSTPSIIQRLVQLTSTLPNAIDKATQRGSLLHSLGEFDCQGGPNTPWTCLRLWAPRPYYLNLYNIWLQRRWFIWATHRYPRPCYHSGLRAQTYLACSLGDLQNQKRWSFGW